MRSPKSWRWLAACLFIGLLAIPALLVSQATGGSGAIESPTGDGPTVLPGATPPSLDADGAEEIIQRDLEFTSSRTAGDIPLDNQQAGALRAAAARTAVRLRKEGVPASGPSAFTGAWQAIGPNPIVQITRSTPIFSAMSGRIGALAIRQNGQLILGGAMGGIWTYDALTGTWTPRTDTMTSLAIGALAVAPSNDNIVYAGTGEGALSGDSHYGDGVIKSTDGGFTWQHVSGDYFQGVSTSRIVVDPNNANHLYAAILRGRGGSRRTTPAVHSRYGIWESKDGAQTWTLLKEAKSELNGATDIEMDPQNASILYASFWGDGIYKSTNGGATWTRAMNGLPAANYAAGLTRFSIGLSHPAGQPQATLYVGFDWIDATGAHPSRVFKSTDGAASWTMLPAGTSPDKVEDYCGGQCFYDNVIEVAPDNPDVVYAAGQFDYGIGSGGIYRSDDGGQTWKNLGWDRHPDHHAFAFDPNNSDHIVSGDDGNVLTSNHRGGRMNAGDGLEDVDWQNLAGNVNPTTAAIIGRSNLQIAQFTSIATVPTLTERVWGGTQDNGTMRKTAGAVGPGGAGTQWFDVASGDGGQVLQDPTNANFVYGTYFGVSPYRYSNGGASFFSNQSITRGINTGDRSEFYIPWTLNYENPNQLFLGTYRVYRTDNAKAPSAGDVLWKNISPDLTTGCTGTAPNGARTCAISAFGVGGGNAVYVGTLDGLVHLSTNAQVSDNPTWTQVGRGELPKRPVAAIAVDRSNYRIAYIGYNGFNAATPSRPGHVFRTLDGGQSWADISGNLPDVTVNSVVLDPSYANTIYVGTDVGAFVTYNGGANWHVLGTGMPTVGIWQLDLDPTHRLMAVGTHGRGAFRMTDSNTVPALVVSKVDAGVPVGPSSNVEYTLKVRNIGNAAASGVTITDPVPANTSFVSADNGGSYSSSTGKVTWSGLSIPAGSSVTVHMTVSIANAIKNKVGSILNDGIRVTSAQGPFTTGSPTVTPIAPPYAVRVTPASQTDGSRVGTSVTYLVTVSNRGFNADSYALSAPGSTFPVSFLDSSCASPLSTTPSLTAGASTQVCVKVDVPASATNGQTNTANVTATSVSSPVVSGSAVVKTIAVAVDTLLVDNDGNGPNVQSYYTTALTTASVPHSVWDLSQDSNLPLHYVQSFKNVVWFTGNSYPGPIVAYEPKLKAFLDGGGRLFMSGHDILDQAAGTTTFVHDYLHIAWDGTENQNDKATDAVHGIAGNAISNGIGAVPIDHSILGAAFEDRITPINGAVGTFTDDHGDFDALYFSGTYKVVFLAFPLESYGTAAQKADLVTRVMGFFGA